MDSSSQTKLDTTSAIDIGLETGCLDCKFWHLSQPAESVSNATTEDNVRIRTNQLPASILYPSSLTSDPAVSVEPEDDMQDYGHQG